ncbi:MAG: hypothetical protein KDE27_21165 [Planctomycetes bacterium]|nr:hypothetical protein [Planctomycetota bacterium]
MKFPAIRSTRRSLTSSSLLSQSRAIRVEGGVDVAVLADATASMELFIDAVKTHSMELLRRLVARHQHLRMTFGFYRDHTCQTPFSFFGDGGPKHGEFIGASRVDQLRKFVDGAGFTEGNDTSVEALGAGLLFASQLPWVARNRVLVCVGDHASHGYAREFVPEFAGDHDSIELCEFGMTHERILACLSRARIRCFMVRCGRDAPAEQQYRDIANKTGGRFVDFQNVEEGDGLTAAVEAAVAESQGGSAVALLERKRREGQISDQSAVALIQAFGGKERP